MSDPWRRDDPHALSQLQRDVLKADLREPDVRVTVEEEPAMEEKPSLIDKGEWDRHRVAGSETEHDLTVLRTKFDAAVSHLAVMDAKLTETIEFARWAKWKLENGIIDVLARLSETVNTLTVRMDKYDRDILAVAEKVRALERERDAKKSSLRTLAQKVMGFLVMGAIGLLFLLASFGLNRWLASLGG